MSPISLGRRIIIALVSLTLAAALFRAPIASALVTRGDDAMRNADPNAAFRYYERALWVDQRSARAADRLAFYLGTGDAPGDARAAITVATTGLSIKPFDPSLLADRALAEQRLGLWTAAEHDFALAGNAGHDARYDHLAGRVALRLGDTRSARHYFKVALIHDPTFSPARAALAQFAP